ncbi:MAG TPA: VWA domain-containing protein [Vicinamibacterales bacterium]
MRFAFKPRAAWIAARRSTAPMCLVLASAVLASIASVAPSENRFVLVGVADKTGQPLLGLEGDDFAIENDGAPCDIAGIAVASYPLALVLDTSSYARTEFRSLQHAAERLVEGLAPRPIAVYVSGGSGSRIADFTTDQSRIARAVANLAAAPNAATRTLEAILRASNDLARLHAPVTGIIVVSAGGIEMNPPSDGEMRSALAASHTILSVVESRPLRLDATTPQQNQGDVLQGLTTRSGGNYSRGTSATIYSAGLQAVRQQLDAQSILEYIVASGAPHSVSVRVKPPGVIVLAVGLER